MLPSVFRELVSTVRALPRAEKFLLTILALGMAGMISVPFFQMRQFSLLRGADSTCYYLWLRSGMVDHDWDFSNDLATCNTLTDFYRDQMLNQPRTELGRVPNKYGIGWSLLAAPFYVVGDGVVVAGNKLGWWQLERDGFNPVYQLAVHLGHLLVGWIGVLLAWQCVRRWIGDARAALWGVVLMLAASPQLYYVTTKLGMSHSAAFFAIALTVWACLELENDPSRRRLWFIAGIGVGLAAILRFQLLLFALIPAVVWIKQLRAHPDLVRGGQSALLWLAGFMPLIALQCFAWHVVYGHWLVFTYGLDGEKFNWAAPEFAKLLFSPYHGWFYWHPLLLLGVAGLIWMVKRGRALAWPALLSVGLLTYVNAAWWCWWLGDSFGSRAFEGALIFLMGGFAFLLSGATRQWSRGLMALGVVASLWNFYLMALFYSGAIERNAPVTWVEMMRAGARIFD